MFTQSTRNPNILRRTWYLSNDQVLCARWTVEKTAPSIENVRRFEGSESNRSVTEACETQIMAECG
jgi:hypothetical protein